MARDRFLGAVSVVLGLIVFVAASATWAAVVNVDFSSSAGDAIHSGSDGTLSTSGTVWTGVLFDTPESDVEDENGATTSVDVTPTAFFSGSTDGSATNDLQDSGLVGNGFDIGGLVAGNSYTLVIYGGGNMGHGITTSTGSTGDFCTGTPTYTLPGTAGLDFCTYANVQPFDLGGGDFGIRISGLDGLITGFQISGTFGGGTPPTVPSAGPIGLVLLVGALGLLGVMLILQRNRGGIV